MKPFDELTAAQSERRFKQLRKLAPYSYVRTGWVRVLRISLGLTLDKLSHLVRLSVSTVADIEKREAQGTVSIGTLRKLAEAMECELIYAFVPKKEIKTLLTKKAYAKARRILARADTHMTLEDQKVKRSLEERIKRLADELLKKGDVW